MSSKICLNLFKAFYSPISYVVNDTKSSKENIVYRQKIMRIRFKNAKGSLEPFLFQSRSFDIGYYSAIQNFYYSICPLGYSSVMGYYYKGRVVFLIYLP